MMFGPEMIRTEFHSNDESFIAEFPLPYPLRVGDKIDLKDGVVWTVVETTLVVDPIMQDPYGGQLFKLLVKVTAPSSKYPRSR
jgi:hypothetical protein